jgi:transcriptional regulator with XRE-family HTH domain
MSGGTETQKRKLRNILRQIRQEANLRQIDLAERLSKPQSFISKFESGEKTLDFFEVIEVCEALNISLYDLIKKLELKNCNGS